METSRKLQIGVMGSAADLQYGKDLEATAEEIGYLIAKNNATLMFGAEKDYDSLSTAACRGAKKAGGLTVGVTYGKDMGILEKNVDVVIASGMERGGGRELALVSSCDGIIAVNGGSGTLTEIAIAYQANRPVVALKNSGGWSERLAGEHLDGRRRIKVEAAETAQEAVQKIIQLVRDQKLLKAFVTVQSSFDLERYLRELDNALASFRSDPDMGFGKSEEIETARWKNVLRIVQLGLKASPRSEKMILDVTRPELETAELQTFEMALKNGDVLLNFSNQPQQ